MSLAPLTRPPVRSEVAVNFLPVRGIRPWPAEHPREARHPAGNDGGDTLQYDFAGTGCISALGGDGSDVLALRASESWADPVQVDLDGGSIGPCGLVDEMETVYLNPAFVGASPPEWQLRGTNHADRIYIIDDGHLVGDLRGGNDVFVGGPGDDIVEGAPGRDRADGYLGTDACTGFEVVVSCEET